MDFLNSKLTQFSTNKFWIIQKFILNQNIVVLNNIEALFLKYFQNSLYHYFGQNFYKVVLTPSTCSLVPAKNGKVRHLKQSI